MGGPVDETWVSVSAGGAVEALLKEIALWKAAAAA